jgi:hypothetical protein
VSEKISVVAGTSIILNDRTRVFRHWTPQGRVALVYANKHGAVLHQIPSQYTDPDQLRELAAGLVAAAERIEAERIEAERIEAERIEAERGRS